MNTKNLMRIALVVTFGPPSCFLVMAAGAIFMYLTEPFGWVVLFLLLGLPLGTVLVGSIIRAGFNNQPGSQPNARHPGWDDRPEPGPTHRIKGGS